MLPKKAISLDHAHYSIFEERINAATHGFGFLLALVGLFALLLKAPNAEAVVVSAIYGTSLAFMFLSSSVYHSVSKPHLRLFLRKVDHAAIYLLIAGTYTPFLLLAVGGNLGMYAAIVVWFIGLAGIIFKTLLGHKYPKLGVATYAIMGWLALFLIYPIYQALSVSGFVLLIGGGIAYSLGIPFYMMKSRHYSHALWHVFVVIGAACHFFAIYYHVL
ncbi:MAG: hemolysin III family protein [Glaciecola sp.]